MPERKKTSTSTKIKKAETKTRIKKPTTKTKTRTKKPITRTKIHHKKIKLYHIIIVLSILIFVYLQFDFNSLLNKSGIKEIWSSKKIEKVEEPKVERDFRKPATLPPEEDESILESDAIKLIEWVVEILLRILGVAMPIILIYVSKKTLKDKSFSLGDLAKFVTRR